MLTAGVIGLIMVMALGLVIYLLWLLLYLRGSKQSFFVGTILICLVFSLITWLFYLPLYQHLTREPTPELQGTLTPYGEERLKLSLDIIPSGGEEDLPLTGDDFQAPLLLTVYYPREDVDPLRATRPFEEVDPLTSPNGYCPGNQPSPNLREHIVTHPEAYDHLTYVRRGQAHREADPAVGEVCLFLAPDGSVGQGELAQGTEEIYFQLTEAGKRAVHGESNNRGVSVTAFLLYSQKDGREGPGTHQEGPLPIRETYVEVSLYDES